MGERIDELSLREAVIATLRAATAPITGKQVAERSGKPYRSVANVLSGLVWEGVALESKGATGWKSRKYRFVPGQLDVVAKGQLGSLVATYGAEAVAAAALEVPRG